jgi:nickel-type superoxide dismutase maturation protease
MSPTLADRHLVLVWQWGRRDRLASPGAVVLVEDPAQRARLLVKRVVSVAGGRVVLGGDNAARSRDSRSFGAVPLDLVRGRALWWGPVP